MFGLSEIKLFHFHEIIKGNELKAVKVCINTYIACFAYSRLPPFQKSWIRRF